MEKISFEQLEVGLRKYLEKEVIDKRIRSVTNRFLAKTWLTAFDKKTAIDFLKTKKGLIEGDQVVLSKLKDFLLSEINKNQGCYQIIKAPIIGTISFFESDVDVLFKRYLVK